MRPGKEPGPLAEQIGRTLEVRQTDLATLQRFLLRELGTSDEDEVTLQLLGLASDARTPPALLDEARSLLAARRSGADHLLAALERKYDFLSDVLRPPPVGPIADALAAMSDRRAAPLLAEHLNDPADSPDDVRRAARALAALATEAEAEPLRTFVALYRATAEGDDMTAAVVDAARALVQVGGREGAAFVRRVATDPLTAPGVKAGVANLVAGDG